MERELWFNLVSRSNVSTNSYSNNSSSTNPIRTTPNNGGQTVACNKCNNGYAIGNMFQGTVCPTGWTTDIDPCNTTRNTPDPLTQTVACNKCDGGYPIGNLFQGAVCPTGWTTDIDPCKTQGTSEIPPEPTICNSCENGYPVGNIFSPYNEDGSLRLSICPEGWTTDKDPCKDDVIVDVTDSVDVTDPVEVETFNNICYSCKDGKSEASIISSELANVCPDGFLKDNVDVCPKPELKDNKDLILYIAIGIGVLVLLKK